LAYFIAFFVCGFAKKTIAASTWSHHDLPDGNIFYCRDELVTQVGDLVTEVGDLVTEVGDLVTEVGK
jgi:hypothetical protein